MAGVGWYRQRPPRDLGPAELVLTLDELDNGIGVPAPSPDGRLMAFLGKDLQGVASLWIRPLDSIDVRRLPGTEGSTGDVVWSPDGVWIAFYAGGRLKKVRPEGGPPENIAAIPGFQDGAWGTQGDIVFRPTNRIGLFRVRDTGGSAQPLTKLNASLTENSHRYPTFLPDGRHFLFVSRCAERANNALYVASIDSSEVKKIMPAQARVSYIPGAVLFYREGTVMAQHFDPDRAQVSGDPVPVLTDVAYNAPSIEAAFRASAGGAVFTAKFADAAVWNMIWYTRNGEEAGRLETPRGAIAQPRISPDGSRVAFQFPDPQTGNRDIWSIEISRGITSRLTNHVANDWFPVWSPDGRQMLFGSDRDGGTDLRPYLKTSMDPGNSESSFGTTIQSPYDRSKDGRWISFGSNDILVAPASRPDAPFVFLATPANEGDPRFSPDSKWIAYSSNESGRSEIYVRPFTGTPAGPSGKVQISDRGGDYPVWSPSGDELYYMSGDDSIYAADTRGLGGKAAIPPPTRLFEACPGTGAGGAPLGGNLYNYDFDTQDGKKFLVVCRAEPPGRFTVLMNWKFPR